MTYLLIISAVVMFLYFVSILVQINLIQDDIQKIKDILDKNDNRH